MSAGADSGRYRRRPSEIPDRLVGRTASSEDGAMGDIRKVRTWPYRTTGSLAAEQPPAEENQSQGRDQVERDRAARDRLHIDGAGRGHALGIRVD